MIYISILQPSEWREYKQIRLESLKENPEAFGSSYEKEVNYSEEKWQERLNDSDTILFVARDENKPVGMVGIHVEVQNNKKVAHIWGMFVSTSCRGNGVGKLLMRELLNEVKRRNEVNVMELMVNNDQTAAVKLYESLGFEKVGEKDWELGDGEKHTLDVMELNL